MKGLFQCPPRAPPWVNIQPTKRPVRAKASYQKAFALTGRLRYIPIIPRACPGLGASALSGRIA